MDLITKGRKLNEKVGSTNGDSRITAGLDDEIRNAKKKIEDRERQIQENLQQMEAKRKDWESENARLSRRVLFTVIGLVTAATLVYWHWG